MGRQVRGCFGKLAQHAGSCGRIQRSAGGAHSGRFFVDSGHPSQPRKSNSFKQSDIFVVVVIVLFNAFFVVVSFVDCIQHGGGIAAECQPEQPVGRAADTGWLAAHRFGYDAGRVGRQQPGPADVTPVAQQLPPLRQRTRLGKGSRRCLHLAGKPSPDRQLN